MVFVPTTRSYYVVGILPPPFTFAPTFGSDSICGLFDALDFRLTYMYIAN